MGARAAGIGKKPFELIYRLPDRRLAAKGQEVRHDRSGRAGRSVHLDMKLSGIDEAALEAKALGLCFSARTHRRNQFPATRIPFDVAAVAFHRAELAGQTMKHRIGAELGNGVGTTLEDTTR